MPINGQGPVVRLKESDSALTPHSAKTEGEAIDVEVHFPFKACDRILVGKQAVGSRVILERPSNLAYLARVGGRELLPTDVAWAVVDNEEALELLGAD